MLKFVATFFVMFAALNCTAQKTSQIDSLHYLLSTIDNSSIKIVPNYVTTLYLDDNARAICQKLTPAIVDKLIAGLSNKEKILVYHVILSKSTMPSKRGLRCTYQWAGDHIDHIIYTYNGLSWKYNKDDVVEIEENDINKIVRYWEGKKGKLKHLFSCQ